MEREMETGKGKIKMSRTEMQKLTLPKWHQNLLETSPENGTCWNTPCSAPQDFGTEEEAPLGCSRGPGCPTRRGEAELSAAAAEAQLGSAPPSPAPPTSAGGEGGNIENLSLSANKSMQVRLQGNLRRSLRRERPDGAGAAATAPAHRKSPWSCFRGGRRP